MIAKLLMAYDGSKQSEKAFGFALDLASKYSAKMLVVAVARPPEPPVAVEMEEQCWRPRRNTTGGTSNA